MKTPCSRTVFSFGWQGDNILIARENLLYSMIDYHRAQFGRRPTLKLQEEFAEIISWNIFQMDGIRYVVPMSCKHEVRITPGELTLFGETPEIVEKFECEGCKFNRYNRHNGKYAKIMDWSIDKTIRFVEIINQNKQGALL